MKLLTLLSAALCSVLARPENHHLAPSHDFKLNQDCCAAKGGVICGSKWPECCRGECKKGWFGMRTCHEGAKIETTAETCPNSCKFVCNSRGGKVCGFSVQSVDCCQESECEGTLTPTCKNKMDLGQCYSDAIFG